MLLPINCGENKILEAHADAIIVACSGDSRTPFWDCGTLCKNKVEGSVANTRAIYYDPNIWTGKVERTGIYIRAGHRSRPWLDSQPLHLGGRRDLIRRSGDFQTMWQDYELWGTLQGGRWDPYMAAMEMTTEDEVNRMYRRRTRKLRVGSYVNRPQRHASAS